MLALADFVSAQGAEAIRESPSKIMLAVRKTSWWVDFIGFSILGVTLMFVMGFSCGESERVYSSSNVMLFISGLDGHVIL